MSAPTDPLAGKYLTFRLRSETYGVPVLKIREILRMMEVTPVPQLPEYIRGVVNLRGKIIPVVDLRRRFRLPDPVEERTCIVVVQVELGAGEKSEPRSVAMGMVVDAVDEVVTVEAGGVEPPPAFGQGIQTSYILGIAKTKGRVTTLIDIDKIVAADALEDIAAKTA